MKITQLSIQDFLGISILNLDKLGKLTKITGDNGVGKSSVLKAITEVFKSSGIDPDLINIDAEKSEILIRLDSGHEIRRTLTPTANRVKVLTENGEPLTKPQEWLNSVVGGFAFSPIKFFLAKPRERREILLKSIDFTIDATLLKRNIGAGFDGLIDFNRFDFSKHGLEVLDDIASGIHDTRREQNSVVTRLRKAVEQDRRELPETFDPDRFKDFDIEAKMTELQSANNLKTHRHDLSQRVNGLRERAFDLVAEQKRLEARLEEVKQELADANREGTALSVELVEIKVPDIDSLRAEIDEYQASQRLIVKLEDIERREGEVEKEGEKHALLDKLYKVLTTSIQRKMLSQVQLPVDDLQITGDKIKIGGVAIDKLSMKEQMAFGVKLARSLAKDLKVICIDDFEHLSPGNRKLFEKEVADDEFEYFITIATDGDLNVETGAA